MAAATRRKMLTYEEVAELLGVSLPTMRSLVNEPDPAKRLQACKIRDRVYRISEDDLTDFLERAARRKNEE